MSAALCNPKAALRELDRLDAKAGLSRFVRLAWPTVEQGTPYVHGWHIDAMAEHLEAVSAGDITRLLINVPPGTMKSLLVGVMWPAWEWATRGGHIRYVAASHEQTLAVRDNKRTRSLVQSDWYRDRWGDHVEISSDQYAKLNFELKQGGFRQAATSGGITGRRGDRVLIDDPHSVEGARSDVQREAVIEWFRTAVPTRLNDPKSSAIVVIMQRLHERDVSGVILSAELGYDHLCLPMEYEPERACVTSIGFRDPRNEPGELLFEERFPREVVERDKRIMGSQATAGQFQQRPAPAEGGLFKRHWIATVDAAPIGTRWVRGWDLAATESETAPYTVGVKLGRTPEGAYIIGDVVRERVSAAGLQRLIVATAQRDGDGVSISIPQDPGQAGKAQKTALARALAGFDARFSPETGDKATRAAPVAAQAEAGNVAMLRAPWNDAFVDELAVFPNGAYADQVDALSRAFMHLARFAGSDDLDFAGPVLITG